MFESMEEILEELKLVNLIDFLETHVGIKPTWVSPSRERAMFYSPLREERNPSFSVFRTPSGVWLWKDWGTGKTGDIVTFVREYYGITFKEAVEMLREDELPPSPKPVPSASSGENLLKKVLWVRKKYRELLRNTTSSALERVKRHFEKAGASLHPEMGIAVHTDFREGVTFACIPIPNPEHVRGLELRGLEKKVRKTWGLKTVWVLKRETEGVLVTESILDTLIGEKILSFHGTLIALNGVGNVKKLEKILPRLSGKVILALDADEPGERATEEAVRIAERLGRKVEVYRNYSGGKDFGEMWKKMRGAASR